MDRKTKTQTMTTTKTLTLTRADVRTSIAKGALTEEEERYVRMRFGISEPATALLTRRGVDFPETRAYLNQLEAGLVLGGSSDSGNPVKDRIVSSLRRS
jgi:hypothetical protein